MRITLSELDAQLAKRARHSSFLEQRTAGRQQNAKLASREPLERFDALAGDLHVGFRLTEPFARRIERHRRFGEQRLEVGEPSLRFPHAVRGDDEEARRETPRDRRDDGGIRGTRQSAGDDLLAGRRKSV